jgi:uncharacterized membrane protein YjjB (DUF3815 family)
VTLLLRKIRRVLKGNARVLSARALWDGQRNALVRAIVLVRVFYVAMFFIQLEPRYFWGDWMKLTHIRLIWPLVWFEITGIRAGMLAVIVGGIATSLLAVMWPHRRVCRALAAVGILEFGAFFNSLGAPNHGPHAWFWVAAIFVLLPDGTANQVSANLIRRQRYLRVFFAAQVALLTFYSLSGAFKLAGTALQMSRGEVNGFSPEALARHTAYVLQEGAVMGPWVLGPWIIRHPYVGWPLFLATIYLEVFSIVVAFRPGLHRFWGVTLILMHMSIFFVMAIMFSWQILLVGLLLVCSPFAPERTAWREVVGLLPVVGDVMRWARGKRIKRVEADEKAPGELASVP